MTNDPARWRDILTREHGPSLALMCLGVWRHAADGLLVATMLPAIVAEIGGTRLISWTVSLYEIGSIIAGASSGLLGLRYGMRLPMVAAAVTFAAGCAISAAAPEMWVLLVGRLLQGLGGGGLMAMSFVAIASLFAGGIIARAMGAVSSVWAVSAFLGPLIGGLFVELASWRAGFWFFALQALLLAGWVATRNNAEPALPGRSAQETFPIPRLLWLGAGVVAIAYGGIETSVLRTSGCALLGLICLVVFIRQDAATGDSRLLPVRPIGFKNPIGAALTLVLCIAASTIAIGIYVPLLLAQLHGTSALVAGYVIAVEALAWTAMALLVSGSPERHDTKLIAAGMLVVTASVAALAYSVPHGPVWLVAASAALQGSGFGMAWTFILRRATRIAPVDEIHRVTAAIPTMQRLGYALGAAYIGIVANAAGIEDAAGNGSLAFAAVTIFIASLPLAGVALVAMARFVSWRSAAG